MKHTIAVAKLKVKKNKGREKIRKQISDQIKLHKANKMLNKTITNDINIMDEIEWNEGYDHYVNGEGLEKDD